MQFACPKTRTHKQPRLKQHWVILFPQADQLAGQSREVAARAATAEVTAQKKREAALQLEAAAQAAAAAAALHTQAAEAAEQARKVWCRVVQNESLNPINSRSAQGVTLAVANLTIFQHWMVFFMHADELASGHL
jgi:flagellar biosynthesis regulator FlaF